MCTLVLFTVSSIFVTHSLVATRASSVQGKLKEFDVVGRQWYCAKPAILYDYDDNDNVAALAEYHFNESTRKGFNLCFSQLRIVGPNGVENPTVLDICEECKQNEVAVSPTLYERMFLDVKGKRRVEWEILRF